MDVHSLRGIEPYEVRSQGYQAQMGTVVWHCVKNRVRELNENP